MPTVVVTALPMRICKLLLWLDIGKKNSDYTNQGQICAEREHMAYARMIRQFAQNGRPYTGNAKGKAKKQTGYQADFTGYQLGSIY